MKYQLLIAALLLSLNYTLSLGQTSYKGLTPGKSRKVEVERVLGQPVKQLSETLIEYQPQGLTGRIYVQYRAGTLVVERMEFICRLPESNCKDFMKSLNLNLPESEAATTPPDDKGRYLAFSAPPYYVVQTMDQAAETENETSLPVRVAFYSRELYEAEVSKAEKTNQATTAENEEATPGDRAGITPILDATAATITRDGGTRPPPLSGAYGEIVGLVKLRAADGSIRPAAFATVDFYRSDGKTATHMVTSTDRNGGFQFVGLTQTVTWVVVVSGPGLQWTYNDKVNPPVTVEIITKPGDGSRPTREQVLAKIQ